MGVQRLPDAGLVPTSQEGGGTVHDNSKAMSAPGSMPGYDGGAMAYPVSTDLPVPQPVPDRSDENLIGSGGAAAQPQDGPFPQAGTFGAESYNAGLWRRTPSS